MKTALEVTDAVSGNTVAGEVLYYPGGSYRGSLDRLRALHPSPCGPADGRDQPEGRDLLAGNGPEGSVWWWYWEAYARAKPSVSDERSSSCQVCLAVVGLGVGVLVGG